MYKAVHWLIRPFCGMMSLATLWAVLFLLHIVYVPIEGQVSTCTRRYLALSKTHTMCKRDVGRNIPLSRGAKQAIVRKHNEYRSKVRPTATNMMKLVWDDNIAVVAAKWARQCRFAHDKALERAVPNLPGVHTGQNLGAGYRTIMNSLIAWHAEVKDFTFGKKATKVVGHYTQVVGHRALRIGCGQARCPRSKYKYIQVCNYAVGQFSNEVNHPYTRGASCSHCRSGKCRNNLCDCGRKVCLNGGELDTKTCSCKCRQPFFGNTCEKDCNGKRCKNGGVLDNRTCQCKCHGIFSGRTCEKAKCPASDPGHCTLLTNCPNHLYNGQCPILCGVCPGPSGCPKKRCKNGAVLKADCQCQCFPNYSGSTCQTLRCPPRSKESMFCKNQTQANCKRFWNLPFLCPHKCGRCR